MKTTILLFILSISSAFSQVECGEQDSHYSGNCESYNSITGVRSKYSYKSGTLHGKFEESYQNGQQRSIGRYKSALLHGKFAAFYETGEKMTVGKFKSGTGSFTIYGTNGLNKIKGKFQDGRPIGEWSYFNENGDLNRQAEVANSRLAMYPFLVGEEPVQNELAFDNFFDSFDSFDGSGFSFSFGDDSDSALMRMQEQMNESMERLQSQMEKMMQGFSDSAIFKSYKFDTTFSLNFGDINGFHNFEPFDDSSFSQSFHFDTIIGEMPQRSNPYFNSPDRDLVDFPDTEASFVGGDDAMNAFIQREMRIVKEKNEMEVNGTVFIEVIVEKDGSISNSRVALGIDALHDVEAERITKEMPLWKPAVVGNQPVRSRSIIPVRFGLN